MTRPFKRTRSPTAAGQAVKGRRALVLCNPASSGGRGARRLPEVEAALRELALPHRVVVTASMEHAIEEADAAATAGDVVATFGGDGIAGRVADVVSRVGGVLAVLPAGRGNDFARAAGLPRDPVAAAEVLATGAPARFDLGEVTAASGEVRRFLGVLSVGIDSEVQRLAESSRIPLGRHAYAYGAVRALAGWRALPFVVDVDGDSHRMTGYTVAVANSGVYGGGMRIAPEARMDDGLLDVVMIAEVARVRLLWALARASKGAHVRAQYVHVTRAGEVAVTAEVPQRLPLVAYADGEPVSPLPVRVRCAPTRLDVLVPSPQLPSAAPS